MARAGSGNGGLGDRPTVVLVHGAFHGRWCWKRVTPLLASAGVRAVAIDLPGHGTDLGPLGDLHDDAARVTATLDRIDGPAVLVGHSYGGAVITEAGHHPAVARLVYLCALALDRHETCQTAAADEVGATGISFAGRPDLGSGLVPGPGGTVTLDPAVAAVCLYQDCDQDTVAWATARIGPQPLVTFQQSPRTVAWRDVPSTYVVCAADQAVHPDVQRLLAQRCTTRAEWPTGHSPFLSRPELVADLLVELARGVARSD
jgi:pimeloyl-ACP methyl ester carboxylesterase